MKTVLDPSVLLISESDWYDDEKKDIFLQHLLENLENIHNYKISQIYWTDDLEKLLWDAPQLPPWRLDRDWNLPIVQIIYRYFNNVKMSIENSKNLNACVVEPNLDCSQLGDLTGLAFLELMHILIDKNENIYLCLGAIRNTENYFFFCNCHTFQVYPLVISQANEWLNYINLGLHYWPQSSDQEEVKKFQIALEIMLKKMDKKALYEYEFDKAFIRDIVSTQNHREDLIKYIAKRLTLTRQEATKDSYLQDEYLAQKKEFRFRITQRPTSTRVHYKYIGKKVRFIRYYGEGEHDDGL